MTPAGWTRPIRRCALWGSANEFAAPLRPFAAERLSTYKCSPKGERRESNRECGADGDDTILGGVASAIAGLIVEGTADNASYIAAGKFGAAPKIGGVKPDVPTDTRFLVP